jgi:lipoprotein NlpI
MSRRHPILAGLQYAVLALTSMAAYAQAPGDAERCANIRDNPDLAIQHCTRAIESGKFSGVPLARLLYNRGIEWATRNQFDRAIADYDASIRIDPKFAEVFDSRASACAHLGDPDKAIADYNTALGLNPKSAGALGGRAVEWMVKGEFARAVADFDAALKLDAKSPSALFGRGRAYFYSGDGARAVADIENAMRIEPNQYTAMWLYIARKRAGNPDAEEWLNSATSGDRAGWPGPLVVLYLGRTDVASVMAAATDRDAKRQAEQRCEANFYTAQWHLLRDERDRAIALLKEAQGGCPKDFLEHEGAVAELRRLQR